jgi:hypothetical protein
LHGGERRDGGRELWPSLGGQDRAASAGSASTAGGGRAPWAAQPNASAQPGGTSSSAIQARTSAPTSASAMTPMLTTIDSGATSDQPRPPSRSSAAGTPAAGSAMHAA